MIRVLSLELLQRLANRQVTVRWQELNRPLIDQLANGVLGPAQTVSAAAYPR